MKWTVQELQILKNGIDDNLSYDEISKLLNGRSLKSISLKSQRMGFKSKYILNLYEEITCDNCKTNFKYLKSEKRKFCSSSCSTIFNNRFRLNKRSTCKNCNTLLSNLKSKNQIFCSHLCHRNYEYNVNIKLWKEGKLKGYRGKTKSISPWLRKYLLDKHDNTCQKCGWNELHPIDNKPLVEINHIDGDASNNNENNLEVLCPNCHSMTENFRARNKNSSRLR